MLREIPNPAQSAPGLRRRWFQDERFDLFVWEDPADGRVQKIELCYDKPAHEKVFAWQRGASSVHQGVDDGERRAGRHKMAPLWVADGQLDRDRLAREFAAASLQIPAELARLVLGLIRA